MTEAEEIADRLERLLPHMRSGTLRFWGQWFGRPHDNRHRIVAGEARGDVLHVRFDAGEVLTVQTPREAVLDARTFLIGDATRVRWEWFYYGRPRTAENRYFEEFTRDDGGVSVATNVRWHAPRLAADPSQPAVEMR